MSWDGSCNGQICGDGWKKFSFCKIFRVAVTRLTNIAYFSVLLPTGNITCCNINWSWEKLFTGLAKLAKERAIWCKLRYWPEMELTKSVSPVHLFSVLEYYQNTIFLLCITLIFGNLAAVVTSAKFEHDSVDGTDTLEKAGIVKWTNEPMQFSGPESRLLTIFSAFSGHDDIIKWKHFPRYWPFVRGIHWSPVNFPRKDQWRRDFMFSLICVWINGWVNKREAGDLRCYHAHHDVTVMVTNQAARWLLYLQSRSFIWSMA